MKRWFSVLMILMLMLFILPFATVSIHDDGLVIKECVAKSDNTAMRFELQADIAGSLCRIDKINIEYNLCTRHNTIGGDFQISRWNETRPFI